MLRIVLQLLCESSYRSAFFIATRYIRPELLMAVVYLCVWVDPLIFGEHTFEGLSWGLWLEFLMAHAHTGTAVVGLAVPVSKPSGKIAMMLMSMFYLMFVIALSMALGSIITVVMFVILSVKRITMPNNTGLAQEILYAFFKVMLFLVTAALGAGIAQFIPADTTGINGIDKGAEIVPAWGVCYFVALYFYEEKMASKFFKTDLRPVTS
jgi:hypothetical protein